MSENYFMKSVRRDAVKDLMIEPISFAAFLKTASFAKRQWFAAGCPTAQIVLLQAVVALAAVRKLGSFAVLWIMPLNVNWRRSADGLRRRICRNAMSQRKRAVVMCRIPIIWTVSGSTFARDSKWNGIV